MSKPQEKPSARSKENIQNFKERNFFSFFYVCGSFLLSSWIRIQIANSDTDPEGTPMNPDPGSATLVCDFLWWNQASAQPTGRR
jgi:hypothetical protein